MYQNNFNQNNNSQKFTNPFNTNYNLNNNNTNQIPTYNNFGINQFNHNQDNNNNYVLTKIIEHNNYMNKKIGCFDYKPIELNGTTKIINYSYSDLKEQGKNLSYDESNR